MTRVALVKLANGKAEEFDAGELALEVGEMIIAETEKGLLLGKVLTSLQEKEKRFVAKAPRAP
jgi:hypothetical protein